jgi:hypothetical protein
MNVFTFNNECDRVRSYSDFGSRSINPSPPAEMTALRSVARCFRPSHLRTPTTVANAAADVTFSACACRASYDSELSPSMRGASKTRYLSCRHSSTRFTSVARTMPTHFSNCC